jgi:hypothetical protein
MPVRAGPNKAAETRLSRGETHEPRGNRLHLSVNAYAQTRRVLIRGCMDRKL